MKKLLLLIPVVALLASACNSSQQATVQTPPATQNNQAPAQQNVNQSDYTQDTSVSTNQNSSGIVITTPKPNEVVILPVTVKGYISGNGWAGFEGEAGSVYITDGNGKVIASAKPLKTTSDSLKLPAYFEVILGDRQMMSNIATNNGYLVFNSAAAKDGEIVKEYKLPIRFK